MATEDASLQVGDEESHELIDDDPITFAALAVLGAILIMAIGMVELPYPLPTAQSPPYTMGMFAVYLVGLTLGPAWGGLSYGLTLTGLVLEIPYLSPQAPGIEALWSSFGGFLLLPGVAAVVVGWIVHRGVYPKRLTDVSIPLQVGALAVAVLLFRPLAAAWLGYMLDFFPLGATVIYGGLWYLPGEAMQALGALVVGTGGTYAVVNQLQD